MRSRSWSTNWAFLVSDFWFSCVLFWFRRRPDPVRGLGCMSQNCDRTHRSALTDDVYCIIFHELILNVPWRSCALAVLICEYTSPSTPTIEISNKLPDTIRSKCDSIIDRRDLVALFVVTSPYLYLSTTAALPPKTARVLASMSELLALPPRDVYGF